MRKGSSPHGASSKEQKSKTQKLSNGCQGCAQLATAWSRCDRDGLGRLPHRHGMAGKACGILCCGQRMRRGAKQPLVYSVRHADFFLGVSHLRFAGRHRLEPTERKPMESRLDHFAVRTAL